MIGKSRLTLNQIFERVSDFDILTYYLGYFNIPCSIKSLIREENNPSFGLFYNDCGQISWKDFKTGQYGNVINLLQIKFQLTFAELITKLNNDIDKIQLNEREVSFITHSKSKRTYKSSYTNLLVRRREWEEYDFNYWQQYGISKSTLELGRIYPIDYFFLVKEDFSQSTFKSDKYAYAFVEKKDGIVTIKLYQPFSKNFKWLNKNNSSVWELWDMLPECGKDLIISSSRKDSLCIWENWQISSIALQSETTSPKEKVVDELKGRFDNIYVFYDNDYTKSDNTGQIFAQQLCKKFNLKNIYIDEKWEVKDPSDFVYRYGRDKFNKLKNEWF